MTKTKQKQPVVPILIGVVILIIAVFLIVPMITSSSEEVEIEYGNEKLFVTSQEIDNRLELANASGIPISRDELIDQLIQLKVLLAEAKSKGIVVEQERIDQQIQLQLQFINSQFSEEQLMTELSRRGLTKEAFEADLRDSVEKDLTIQKLFEVELYDTVEVNDALLNQLYEDNKAQFVVAEKVSARHILICYDGATQCSQTRTKEEAFDLAQELKFEALTTPFETLAQEYSDGPSGASGGDLGEFERGVMVPAFETEAFATNVGEISDPVETQFGYHIITVYGRQDAQELTFEDVKPQLEQQYRLQISQGLEQSYVDGLLAQTTINK